MSASPRRLQQTRFEVVWITLRIVREDLPGQLIGGEEFEDVDHAHADTADSGPAASLVGPARDSCEQHRRVQQRETRE